MLKYFLPLFALPAVFAEGSLTAMDLIWYMIGFCVIVILFILHHMMIEHDLKRKKA